MLNQVESIQMVVLEKRVFFLLVTLLFIFSFSYFVIFQLRAHRSLVSRKVI